MSDFTTLVIFVGVVLSLLIIDLFVLNRKEEALSVGRAAWLSAFWICLSLAFGAWIWMTRGSVKGMEFFTGYVIEYALSVDNLFVFVMLFTFFKVDPRYQHRVLFWGIIGALVMRGTMILIGAALVERFGWILYIFGVFLLFTGIKMLMHKDDETTDLENNPILKFCRRILPITPEYHGKRFTVVINGRRWLTPLALVLIMVETTDLIFAVDSIPAIFAITTDEFIIFTSNVCAILGLRSLYFLLAGVMNLFTYLKIGLSLVLIFIGAKMLIRPWIHLPIEVSLGVVVTLLAGSVLASVVFKKAKD
jgi:tellurite resistance protein TerC